MRMFSSLGAKGFVERIDFTVTHFMEKVASYDLPIRRAEKWLLFTQ